MRAAGLKAWGGTENLKVVVYRYKCGFFISVFGSIRIRNHNIYHAHLLLSSLIASRRRVVPAGQPVTSMPS